MRLSTLPLVCLLAALPAAARAADAPAAAAKTTGGLPGYQIISLGRGHNNRLLMAATIGGKKGLMMLDTGANYTALNEVTYHSLLPDAGHPLPSGVPKTVMFNGTPNPLAIAPDFRVGSANLGSLPVCLVPGRYLYDTPLDRTASDLNFDGMFGENILRHYNAIVDCGRLALYLNTGPAKKLSLASAFVGAGWTRVPMSDIHNDFTVSCIINGHHFRMIVDTGAPFTAANQGLLHVAQVPVRDLPMLRSGLVGMRAQDTALASVSAMQIGDYTATNVHMTSTNQSFAMFGGAHDESKEGAILGLLGGDVLAANAAVVDVGNKSLYLKRGGSGSSR